MRALIAALSLLFATGVAAHLLARFVFDSRLALVELFGDFMPMVLGLLFVLLILNTVLKSWRTVLVLLPLLVLMAAIFAPYYFPKRSSPPSGTTIDVVSFNVSCQNTRMADVENWLRSVSADLVFLQELSEDYAGPKLDRLLDAYPYQTREPRHLRSCANMILSRHPLRDPEYLPMTDSGPAFYLQRMAVSINGTPVVLYNVHFDKPIFGARRQLDPSSGTLSSILPYDPEQRNQQIERLTAMLAAETRPFVVAGDFNMTEFSALHAELSGIAQDAFRRVGVGLGGTWPAKAKSLALAFLPTTFRIDYIWLSEGWRAVDAHIGPRIGSDHLPVLATLQWSGLESGGIRHIARVDLR
jgi:endonuclease/exonuclease/phosphatase (EEP) superfamily protein YafD